MDDNLNVLVSSLNNRMSNLMSNDLSNGLSKSDENDLVELVDMMISSNNIFDAKSFNDISSRVLEISNTLISRMHDDLDKGQLKDLRFLYNNYNYMIANLSGIISNIENIPDAINKAEWVLEKFEEFIVNGYEFLEVEDFGYEDSYDFFDNYDLDDLDDLDDDYDDSCLDVYIHDEFQIRMEEICEGEDKPLGLVQDWMNVCFSLQDLYFGNPKAYADAYGELVDNLEILNTNK